MLEELYKHTKTMESKEFNNEDVSKFSDFRFIPYPHENK